MCVLVAVNHRGLVQDGSAAGGHFTGRGALFSGERGFFSL